MRDCDAYAPGQIAERVEVVGVATFGTFIDAVRNLAVVTLGNMVGGTFLVAGIYWIAYLRPGRRSCAPG